MSITQQHTLSRRSFCICCSAAAGFAATSEWLSPSQAYAKARSIVDLIRDEAAKAPIKVHKLHGNVSILEGSGGNVAVLTGSDGKLFVDAGITASRPRILKAADRLSGDPITHLINTHSLIDETIAAKPTAAFDAKWGQFVITPEFFTRLVYQGV